MTLYTLPNATDGIDSILAQTIIEVPLISPLLLVFVYLVVFIGGIVRQKQRIGYAEYAMWSVVASLAILLVGLLMSVVSGYIRLDNLVIVVGLNLISFVWLAFSKSNII